MWNIIRRTLDKKKWARWNNTPKDLVILHTFGKANTLPSASPYVVKTQTYLRMAKIPHKTDSKDMLGPKGKAPWISLNGEHIGDSELIIKHLNRHFKVDLNKGPYSERELAIATCARVTLEEHFAWGLALERFIYNPSQFKKVVGVNPLHDKIVSVYGKYLAVKRTDAQGIGKHSEQEVLDFCTKDLRAVSNILGGNEYLLGSVPCQDDCGVFGMLAVIRWGLPDSPYERILKNDLTNLNDYCMRMKAKYYPDWEQCIRGLPGQRTSKVAPTPVPTTVLGDSTIAQQNKLKSKS